MKQKELLNYRMLMLQRADSANDLFLERQNILGDVDALLYSTDKEWPIIAIPGEDLKIMKKVKGYFLQKMTTKVRCQTEITDCIPHFSLLYFSSYLIYNYSMLKNYSNFILKDILHPFIGQVV